VEKTQTERVTTMTPSSSASQSGVKDTAALLNKNLDYFEKNHPELHTLLKGHNDHHCVLTYKDGEIDNLLIDDTPFYGTSAQKYCDNQMKDFWRKPERIIFENVATYNPTPVSKGMMEIIADHFIAKTEGLERSQKPITDCGFCFVFGLGLGLFLPEMIEKKIARNIIISEPVTEFFHQSLHILDWEKIYTDAEENGISLIFTFYNTPSETVEFLERTVRHIGNTFLDGSSFFIHYPSWENIESFSLFRDRIRIYYQSSGFFEDELIMLRNAYLNMTHCDFRFVKRKPYLHQDYPVFVIASGPSLEFDLANIKKMRDRIIIVSSGTTISLLLSNGIRPDFHAELENGIATFDFLSIVKEKHGFDGITLLASTSVYDGVANLFDETYFFHRSGSSSAIIFDNDIGEIPEISPMAANAATSAIASLGFRNIYFAGVDCGKYEGASHHAKGTIYDDLGIDLDVTLNQFTRIVPGNFGGKVSTTIHLDMSRRNLIGIVRRLQLNAYNCSHGARIDGAKPISSGAIKLNSQPGKQQYLKKSLRDQATFYKNGSYFNALNLKDKVLLLSTLAEKTKTFMAEAYEQETSIYDFEHNFESFWNENYDEYKDILSIIGGTMGSMFRLAGYVHIRLPNDEQRMECLKITIKAIEKQTLWMLETLHDFLSAMAEGKTDVPLPDPYPLQHETKET
jgi:hypothetical protein